MVRNLAQLAHATYPKDIAMIPKPKNTKYVKPADTGKGDFADAATVCHAIHGDGPFGLVTFKRGTGDEVMAYAAPSFAYATYAEHSAKFPMYIAQGVEPFILAGFCDGKSHGDSNITHTWAVCVDFDNGMPEFLLDNPLVKPSILIETSAARYHAVWVLDAYCYPEEVRPVLKAMADRLGGDFAYAKPSQLIRLPGFDNAKRAFEAVLVKSTDPTKAYSLDYLKQAFDFELVTSRIQHAVPSFNSALHVLKTEHNAENVAEDAKAALQYLNALADDYHSWLKILMALVPLGDTGMELAEAFSQASTKYDPDGFKKKWAAIQKSPGRVSTIFLEAQRLGWKNPGYRRKEGGTKQMVTSRELGRMIAARLGNDYAVILLNTTRKPILLAWDGLVYKPVSPTARRQIVEQVGAEVIASLLAQKAIEIKTQAALKYLLGKNKSIEEVYEHVADAMQLSSERRVVGQYPYFGVANGVLNTISLTLVPARYRPIPLLSTKVGFDPAATAPTFERVVNEIFEGDRDLVRYIYQLAGYMLVGKRTEELFIVFLGPSASNGKNTLANQFQHVLGDYAMALPITTIMTKSHVSDGATPTLARLDGKRLAVVSEPNPKHAIDSGAVKSMTGDKVLSVREIYAEQKDISLNFLLLMLANKMPIVRDNDNGLWRRMKIIPFNRHFTREEADGNLGDKLVRESSGILNMMIAGALDYLLNGMKEPQKVQFAIIQEKSDVDPVEAFIADALLLDEGSTVPLKALYDPLYLDWRKQNPSFLQLTKRQFMERLEAKGFKKSTKSHLVYYTGLRPNNLGGAD
jgi:P4 family phage/plasmid primase-like protien